MLCRTLSEGTVSVAIVLFEVYSMIYVAEGRYITKHVGDVGEHQGPYSNSIFKFPVFPMIFPCPTTKFPVPDLADTFSY